MFGPSESDSLSRSWRIRVLRLAAIGLFLWLLAVLVRTQIFAGHYYRSLSEGNRVQKIPIHAPRGIIYDRNGIALTTDLPAFRFNGKTISKDQAIALEAAGQKESGALEIDSVRSYPKGAAFAHILGYVSEVTAEELEKNRAYSLGDKIGRGGVEEEYETRLRGRAGSELVEVDAVGKKLRVISTLPPKEGQNVILTIDAALQTAASEAMEGKKGAVVGSNPQSGEILALVSSPSFNPGQVADFLDHPDKPIFNRAVGGTFPPGSTFKIVTATAGLETGAINKDTTIEDVGILTIGPFKFPNWLWLKRGQTDGMIDVVAAIRRSNDIFFYRTGERTGVEGLTKWAKKFGLGESLGIDLPGEAAGIIRRDRDWYLGDTYHLAIGQGDLLVTPLQVNNWTSIIANGGKLCRPHVLGNLSNLCQDLRISPETMELIQKGMTAACSPGGTGWPLFDFKPQVACKTGTAEFGDSQNRTHAWFTVFVLPGEALAKSGTGPLALTVLVEGGGEGSDVAAPIARKILESWFAH